MIKKVTDVKICKKIILNLVTRKSNPQKILFSPFFKLKKKYKVLFTFLTIIYTKIRTHMESDSPQTVII